jgi:hypothetical protein
VIWGPLLGDPPMQAYEWAGALLITASIVALALARGRGTDAGADGLSDRVRAPIYGSVAAIPLLAAKPTGPSGSGIQN